MPYETRKVANEQSDTDKIFVFLNKLDMKFDKISEDFKSNLDKQTIKVRNEFQKHLSEFDDKLVCVIKEQSAKVCELESVNENNERISRLNDVVIKGVPFTQNEKLFEVFNKIAVAIKYDQSKFSSLNNLFRLKSSSETRSQPILLQFSTQLLRREFMSKYFAHANLKLNHIGFTSENRIYACDNLTKQNNSILQKALAMVADKRLSKVRTRAGYVNVQLPNKTDFVLIKSVDDLDNVDREQLDVTIRENV